MSEELVTLVCEAFARWKAGDYEQLGDFFVANATPDVELCTRLGGLGGEPYIGHDGVRAWLADIQENFESFTPWQEEVLEAGADRVVAVGGIRFRARESGIDMNVPWGWIYEFSTGRLNRMLFYGSPGEALEAAGLSD
ncbi:MAG: nuclear transport factor 2 family protein [Thermoleophilaceae bacterium]|nr:nuclear transport factor 2 family protein [Thermoleophilaceae bacterium]